MTTVSSPAPQSTRRDGGAVVDVDDVVAVAGVDAVRARVGVEDVVAGAAVDARRRPSRRARGRRRRPPRGGRAPAPPSRTSLPAADERVVAEAAEEGSRRPRRASGRRPSRRRARRRRRRRSVSAPVSPKSRSWPAPPARRSPPSTPCSLAAGAAARAGSRGPGRPKRGVPTGDGQRRQLGRHPQAGNRRAGPGDREVGGQRRAGTDALGAGDGHRGEQEDSGERGGQRAGEAGHPLVHRPGGRSWWTPPAASITRPARYLRLTFSQSLETEVALVGRDPVACPARSDMVAAPVAGRDDVVAAPAADAVGAAAADEHGRRPRIRPAGRCPRRR